MSNFVALQIPEAWKPIFIALADEGMELQAALPDAEQLGFRHILQLEGNGLQCFLRFWDEPEWCGNNFQNRALTVVGLSWQAPQDQADLDEYTLLMTGNWAEEVRALIQAFFQQNTAHLRTNALTDNELQW